MYNLFLIVSHKFCTLISINVFLIFFTIFDIFFLMHWTYNCSLPTFWGFLVITYVIQESEEPVYELMISLLEQLWIDSVHLWNFIISQHCKNYFKFMMLFPFFFFLHRFESFCICRLKELETTASGLTKG